MKLKIQIWLESETFSETVHKIFNEAIVCFKTDAYRASMVLSYIGFLTILKERLLQSPAPAGIPTGLWSSILADIQDEDKWDAKIRDETQRKSPAAIFIISDDLRQQILYWKNRRNDCAHFKPTEIRHYHIESFWSFLQDNVSKLVVNGSLAALRNKIQNHFDISLTPADQDASQLVSEIATAISPVELPGFFVDVHSIFIAFSISNQEKELKFYNEIFRISNNTVKLALAEFIKTDSNLLLDFLRYKPERITEFSLDATSVRNLWHSILFSSGQNDFSVYVALLANSLIPAAQIQEAHEAILEKVSWVCKPNNVFQRQVLNDTGFYAYFLQRLIHDRQLDQWGWANPKANLIADYMEHSALSEEIIRVLYDTFRSGYNPHDVRDALNRMFNDNPTKKAEFLSIAATHSIAIPPYLYSLN
jgi:hypothetical protein